MAIVMTSGRSPYAGALGLDSMPFDQIVSIMRQRRTQDAPLLEGMRQTRDRYNGDVVVPLTDVKGFPVMDQPVPRLIVEAIDHTAMACNSVLPRILCPPINMSSPTSRDRATTRERALNAAWHDSKMMLKLYRSYRHLIGYGTCSFVVMPDDERQCPRIEIRDPLSAYPELRMPDDIREPKNVGFLFGRSVDWIAAHYPEAEAWIKNAAGRNWDTLWDLVEWIDENEIVVGIMGPRMPAYQPQDSRPYGYTSYELRRWKNRAGMVPVCVPRRVTLDQIQGQLTALIGMTDMFARLTALDIVAAEKAIFPDMVIISKNGAPPILANGQWMDGRSGKPNLISDASVEILSKSPGPMTQPIIANLESAIRSTGNVQDMFGGGMPEGARTGRAMQTLGSYSVQPRVQEAQTIMESSLCVVNEAFMEVAKGYYGDKKFFVFAGLPGDLSPVEYTPNVDFEITENLVSYPFPGMDVNSQTVAVAQLTGAELISKRTGRYLHPMISDPQAEEQTINREAMESAARAGILAQLQQGQMPMAVGFRIIELLDQGEDLVKAGMRATAEAAEAAQTQQQPQGPPAGASAGDMMGAALGAPGAQPQTQPGGGPPGPPGSQPGQNTPIPPPANALQNFRHTVQAINENTSPTAV